MQRFGLKTVFSKLFVSVMLTLLLFAGAMIALTHLIHDNSAETKWQVLAQQIVNQIDPFVDDLDNAIANQQRLQARFMLAVIKKSFDIFDESLHVKLGLYDREGHLLIETDDSKLPRVLPDDPTWLSRLVPSLSAPAPKNVQAVGDRGYILLYEPRNPPQPSELYAFLNLFTGTLALLALMTVMLWWIARSMTWRINRMSQKMLQLGEGDFSVRVPAKGTDEIATLAKGFNHAAQKIEQLIDANSLLLAHASHELRTPITRIRLQIEMMQMLTSDLPTPTQQKFQKRAEAIKRDLTGLNDLVESILLVSRLDAGHAVEKTETLDLFAVVSLECQHYPEATLFGEAVLIEGQPNLLVHLIRNLLNNALIHGKPPIEVHLYGVASEKEALNPPQSLHPVDSSATESAMPDASADLTVTGLAATELITDVLNKADLDTPTVVVNKNKETLKHTRTSGADSDGAPSSGIVLTSTTKFKPRWADKPPALVANTALLKDIKSESKPADVETNEAADNSPTKTNKASKAKAVKAGDGVFSKRLRRTKPDSVPKPNFAVLAVIDQGTGIPLEKRNDIFSPFVRLQQQNKGSGLGLSLVAQIVEAHHGRILTDVYQGHTRFLVILPTSNKTSVTQQAS